MAGMLSCAFSNRSENSDMANHRFVSKSVNVSVSVMQKRFFEKVFNLYIFTFAYFASHIMLCNSQLIYIIIK